MSDLSTLLSSKLPARVLELLDARPRARAAFDKQAAVLAAGSRIRALREASKLSQSQLAKLVGTTQAHISDLERSAGKQGPSVVMMKAIEHACDAGERSLETLVEGVVGKLPKGKLEAMARTLQTTPSARAVASALVILIREKVPEGVMQGISQSDVDGAAEMIGFLEQLQNCSFVPIRSEAEFRDVLSQGERVLAVVR